jgi:N-acyl-D-amino-acid deacylase
MTGLAASRYRIEKRGELMKGYFADIVIFNKDTIDEKFLPGETPSFAGGIDSVFLNGNLILHRGEFNNTARSGRVLRAS